MRGLTIDELKIGDRAYFEKIVSEDDVYSFAEITGDFNPLHVDEKKYKDVFKKRIAHGALIAGYLSACIGMYLPGPGTIYLSQNSKFNLPVYFGDTIKVEIEVLEIYKNENIAKLKTTCTNSTGHKVLTGEAFVMPPSK
ncbi:MaoC family dehydratase [Clostridium sp. WLY-B-L2]|uniref:MaoC family dehydratase n=1 Tax=Clostridium aromativorans TaxID=2836848 RepID=A0ABS8N643_9CLOT|nr:MULTISPECIES: MaoC family dehydratase [Clostridium]KAA8680558.1 MaoC family dehydratase [Clostridium sp. HV4-5-A1G]MCC9295284.1 MaoC family dehydratase [Clostridium aromativorans]CAB1261806.1 enoyl-CoA hydratase [Clostridiaceae bacterium BL-3]